MDCNCFAPTDQNTVDIKTKQINKQNQFVFAVNTCKKEMNEFIKYELQIVSSMFRSTYASHNAVANIIC